MRTVRPFIPLRRALAHDLDVRLLEYDGAHLMGDGRGGADSSGPPADTEHDLYEGAGAGAIVGAPGYTGRKN